MRTTVDVSPALLRQLRTEAQRRGLSLKAMLDAVLRRGLRPDSPSPRKQTPLPRFAMGAPIPGVDLDRALALAGALEDAAIQRELDERR